MARYISDNLNAITVHPVQDKEINEKVANVLI